MLSTKDIFFDLVQIDSPTGEEKTVAEFVFNFLKDLGYDPEILNNNVYCKIKGDGESIFLNAHLDTVEPGRNIKPEIKDGNIVSAGDTILGADNKVAVAAILGALSKAREFNTDIRSTEILFTFSEEIGNYGAIEFDKTKIISKYGFIFDKEGDLGEIVTCSPYYARFDVEIIGEAAHAARRENSKPVIDTFIKLLEFIESLRSENLLINVGKINGGLARNTVMGSILLNGEIRSYDREVFYECIERIQNESDSLNGDIRVNCEVTVENPGYVHSEDLINTLKSYLKKVTKINFTEVPSYGCSDANIFNEDKSISVFNLSDGS